MNNFEESRQYVLDYERLIQDDKWTPTLAAKKRYEEEKKVVEAAEAPRGVANPYLQIGSIVVWKVPVYYIGLGTMGTKTWRFICVDELGRHAYCIKESDSSNGNFDELTRTIRNAVAEKCHMRIESSPLRDASVHRFIS